jgi:hypothetical protein
MATEVSLLKVPSDNWSCATFDAHKLKEFRESTKLSKEKFWQWRVQ